MSIIKGDVEVLKLEDLDGVPVADGEPERGGLCPDCGGSPHDETPHEYNCPRNPEFREDRKKAL